MAVNTSPSPNSNKNKKTKNSPTSRSMIKPDKPRAAVKTVSKKCSDIGNVPQIKNGKIPIDAGISMPRKLKPTADFGSSSNKTTDFIYQIMPFIILVTAVFFGVCIFFQDAMGIVGSGIRNVLLGLLSGAAFTIPLFMVYHACFWHSDEMSGILARKVICSGITLIQLSILMQVFTSDIPKIWNLSILYKLGLIHKGGGAIGGFLGTLLMSCFGIAGTLIIVISTLFILLLAMVNITPKSLWTYILYKIKMIKINYMDTREEARRVSADEAEIAAKTGKVKPVPIDENMPQKSVNNGGGIRRMENNTNHAAVIKMMPQRRYKVSRTKLKNIDIKLDDEPLSLKKIAPNEILNVIDTKIFEEELERINNQHLSVKKKFPSSPSLTPESDILSKSEKFTTTIDSIPDNTNDVPKTGRNMIITDNISRIFDKVLESSIKPEVTPADIRSPIEDIANEEYNLDNYFDNSQKYGDITDLNKFEETELPIEVAKIEERIIGSNTISHSVPRLKKVITPVENTFSQKDKDIEQIVEDEILPLPEYVFPPIEMLALPDDAPTSDIREELQENAVKLVETLNSFKVKTKIVDVSRGATITRYELMPESGTRVRSISNLVDDIALNLATTGVRIESPIPGKSAVGIEVPNKNPTTVHLRKLIETEAFYNSPSRITTSLGEDVGGTPVFLDISKMPHLLIAGATGMGKSVCINSLIVSLLYKATPDEVKLILIDPKKVELSIYNGLPHLLVPVVSDPKKAAGSLAWAVSEMERRFELIEAVGVRDIKNYNIATKDDPEKEFMPQVVIIIDELADLMMTAPDEVEESICRLAQKARAAGMHIIIGTQRPSVDVITGLIKANIPSRIAFTVASQVDSRTIIDIAGAEKLIGRGDMLYAPVGASKPIRVQGAFVSEGDVEKIVTFIKTSCGQNSYSDDVMEKIEREAAQCGVKPGKKSSSMSSDSMDDSGSGEDDPLLRGAIELAVESGKISTSLIQRRMSLGYGRAAKLIDKMQFLGYVSPPEGQKPRDVLITKQQYMEMVLRNEDGIV